LFWTENRHNNCYVLFELNVGICINSAWLEALTKFLVSNHITASCCETRWWSRHTMITKDTSQGKNIPPLSCLTCQTVMELVHVLLNWKLEVWRGFRQCERLTQKGWLYTWMGDMGCRDGRNKKSELLLIEHRVGLETSEFELHSHNTHVDFADKSQLVLALSHPSSHRCTSSPQNSSALEAPQSQLQPGI